MDAELAAGVGPCRLQPVELLGLTASQNAATVSTAFNTMAEPGAPPLDRQRRPEADASHQLRNPLAVVRLLVDTLDDHVSYDGRSTYESMTAELDRLENLQKLLRLARVEEAGHNRRLGLVDPVTESTDLAAEPDRRAFLAGAALWSPDAQGGLREAGSGWPAVNVVGCIWPSPSFWCASSTPTIGSLSRWRSRPKAVWTTSHDCAPARQTWNWRWPTLPSGTPRPDATAAPFAVARVYENYLQGGRSGLVVGQISKILTEECFDRTTGIWGCRNEHSAVRRRGVGRSHRDVAAPAA